jgi:hypothetical protein
LGELAQDREDALVRRATASLDWLETKAYKMHIRVLCPRYRA